MVPIMGRRFTAVLISLVVFTCQWLMPAPAHAAMDVAKQVLIGADSVSYTHLTLPTTLQV